MGFLDKARQAGQDARDKAQAKYSELEETGRIDEWKTKAKEAIDKGERTVNDLLSGEGTTGQASTPPPAPATAPPSSPPPASPPPSASPPVAPASPPPSAAPDTDVGVGEAGLADEPDEGTA